MAGDSYRRIKAQAQGYEMLKLMSQAKSPMTAAEIAQGMGESVNTVLCWLMTALDAGFVRRENDVWEIGMGVALFWARVKANLEGQHDRIVRDLTSIGADHE